jgi:aspartyl-tRNA(Asn)/glutamyl-tRNA(Gln) amidotransferase subunit A
LPELAELPLINSKGGFVGAEAYAWHRDHLEARADLYDPWVRARFDAGKSQSAADYVKLGEHRERIRAAVAHKQTAFDAFILPTVQIAPPAMADLIETEQSNRINLLCLRNTAVGNFLDLPAVSIPCHEEGTLPVGAMLMGHGGGDRRLLSLARGLEQTIRGR